MKKNIQVNGTAPITLKCTLPGIFRPFPSGLSPLPHQLPGPLERLLPPPHADARPGGALHAVPARAHVARARHLEGALVQAERVGRAAGPGPVGQVGRVLQLHLGIGGGGGGRAEPLKRTEDQRSVSRRAKQKGRRKKGNMRCENQCRDKNDLKHLGN